jgi:hypothetical protein
MRKVPMAGPALIILAIVAGTPAQAAYQSTTEATGVQSRNLRQLALNPQPEPPGRSGKQFKKKKKIEPGAPVKKKG